MSSRPSFQAPYSTTTDPTRLSRRKWTQMAGGWSLILIPWFVAGVVSEHSWPVRALLALSVLGYAAVYIFGLFEAKTRDSPALSFAVLGLMAGFWLAMAFGLGAGSGVLYTISFLVAATIALLPRVAGLVGAVVVLGLALAVGVVVEGGIQAVDVIGLVAITVAMIGMFGMIRVNSELRDAREELARMAVIEERERIARDLHDVLGHSLTTITVKAALARRLLESGDTGRATEEVTDVERLGRQALADVRSTVAANRVASLAAEVAGAREALRAAGIAAELPIAIDDVPAERQGVFAYVLREGVTNVIRHSGAGSCAVRLTPDSLEILDDGVGAPASTPAGNGQSGLAERVAAVGGWLETGPRGDGGYRLAAVFAPARPARTAPAPHTAPALGEDAR
ncbi:MAG: histidine kinase [Pseudonocardia sp.]|nr:histidine kinase [Pseudonocardia sp.]